MFNSIVFISFNFKTILIFYYGIIWFWFFFFAYAFDDSKNKISWKKSGKNRRTFFTVYFFLLESSKIYAKRNIISQNASLMGSISIIINALCFRFLALVVFEITVSPNSVLLEKMLVNLSDRIKLTHVMLGRLSSKDTILWKYTCRREVC